MSFYRLFSPGPSSPGCATIWLRVVLGSLSEPCHPKRLWRGVFFLFAALYCQRKSFIFCVSPFFVCVHFLAYAQWFQTALVNGFIRFIEKWQTKRIKWRIKVQIQLSQRKKVKKTQPTHSQQTCRSFNSPRVKVYLISAVCERARARFFWYRSPMPKRSEKRAVIKKIVH